MGDFMEESIYLLIYIYIHIYVSQYIYIYIHIYITCHNMTKEHYK